jgi:hypothetical protein
MCPIHIEEFLNKSQKTTSCYIIISVKRTSKLKLCPIRNVALGEKLKYAVYKYSHLHTPQSVVFHSRIPEIYNCNTSQISSYSHCTHIRCNSVKPVLHLVGLGTNAFLSELNYISAQRKQFCYGLPGLQPKISLCGASSPLGSSCRIVFLRGEDRDHCHNKLTTASFPIGRNHRKELQGTLYNLTYLLTP